MSTEEHRRTAPARVSCFVLTISDTRTEENDLSGDTIVGLLATAGHTIMGRALVKDDPDAVCHAIIANAPGADVVITTGGTGITSRDSTYEAIAGLLEKQLDGFGELFRVLSYQEIGSAAMLTRACAGTIGRTAIFALPARSTRSRLGMTQADPSRNRPRGAGAETMTTMRPIRETLPLDEAMALIRDAAVPIARIERVPIREASGRVLAAATSAAVDVPPFDRAAMDGYAVVAEDTFGAGRYEPKILRSVGKVYTGELPTRAVRRGECIEIATGAPMPEGADAVVMVEETEKAGEAEVRVFTPVYPRQHVGRRAADIAAGQSLLAEGDVLNPSRIGALAAVGVFDVDVYQRPRVAVLSTGNEIVEPGHVLGPGQIYDINHFTLTAIIGEHGGVAVPHPPAPDVLPELVSAIRTAAEADIVVFSGGSSVGERDLIMDALMQIGEVIFHGIAVKPGKPTVFGRIGATPVFGMPGYPTSCLSNAYMLLVPVLRQVARLPPYEPRTVTLPLSRRIVSTTGRHQFYTVRIADGQVVPAFKGSGDITSMSQADGYIEIPAQTDIVEAGRDG